MKASIIINRIIRECEMLLKAPRNEKFVYGFLKGRGVIFKYQEPVHPYCLDFYFPAKNLDLELDGKYHESMVQTEKDKKRDDFLIQNYGIKTARLKKVNEELLETFLETHFKHK